MADRAPAGRAHRAHRTHRPSGCLRRDRKDGRFGHRGARHQPRRRQLLRAFFCSQEDFYVKLRFSPVNQPVCPAIDGRDDAIFDSCSYGNDEPKDRRFHTLAIELWDHDPPLSYYYPDDPFDINPNPASQTLAIVFDACTLSWEAAGVSGVFGPDASPMPAGVGPPGDRARIVMNVTTDDGLPFTPNDLALVGLSPVQAAFDPAYAISGKPGAMRVRVASTYTGDVIAPVTVRVSDGISTWQETRVQTFPPRSVTTFYVFDGMVAGSAPFVPFKPPQALSATLTYSASLEFEEQAPPGTPVDLLDCYQANNSIFDKKTPIIRTKEPLVVYQRWDWDPEWSVSSPAQLQTMAQQEDTFRLASWPIAAGTGVPIKTPVFTTFGWGNPISNVVEPALTMSYMNLLAALVNIDKWVLVPRNGWFAANGSRSAALPGGAIGLSLGEFAPRVVIAEEGHFGTATHELGHTYKLSQRPCSTGGFWEQYFGIGCRDEYKFGPGDGAPFLARGLDVMGAIYPSGASDSSIGCVAVQPGTREVCQRNLMDLNASDLFRNWTDTATYNYLAERLRPRGDPEMINLSGFAHLVGSIEPGPMPPVFEGTLDFAYHTTGTPDLEESTIDPASGQVTPSGNGPFAVHLVTPAGDHVYRFMPAFVLGEGQAPLDYGFFSFEVPWDPATTKLVFYAPNDARDPDCTNFPCDQGQHVIFTRDISAGLPAVQSVTASRDGIPAPGAGAPPTIGPGHDAVLDWSATDADSTELRYALMVRRVDAAGGFGPWVPYTVEFTGTQFRIRHDWLGDDPGDYMAQLFVSDGINSSSFGSGTLFNICNTANSGVEICNGIDDDCDGTVDNVVVPPGGVRVSVSGAAVSWAAYPAAQSYDAVRGDLGILRTSGGNYAPSTLACLANDTTALSAAFPGQPLPGQGFWSLVRAGNCAGAGTYDEVGSGQQGSRDAGIAAAPAACP